MKVIGDHFLPYDPKLIESARRMRRKPTPAEFKMWYFLRYLQPRFLRQRPIDKFIVDIYCPELNLVIEIDGDQHYNDEGLARDVERTEILKSHGLTVMRFTNSEVLNSFDEAKNKILKLTNANERPLIKGTDPTEPRGEGGSGDLIDPGDLIDNHPNLP